MDMRDGRLVFSECKSGGAKTCTSWGGWSHIMSSSMHSDGVYSFNFSGNGDTREDEIFPGVYWGFSTLFY